MHDDGILMPESVDAGAELMLSVAALLGKRPAGMYPIPLLPPLSARQFAAEKANELSGAHRWQFSAQRTQTSTTGKDGDDIRVIANSDGGDVVVNIGVDETGKDGKQSVERGSLLADADGTPGTRRRRMTKNFHKAADKCNHIMHSVVSMLHFFMITAKKIHSHAFSRSVRHVLVSFVFLASHAVTH
jgi:hypothetical protein